MEMFALDKVWQFFSCNELMPQFNGQQLLQRVPNLTQDNSSALLQASSISLKAGPMFRYAGRTLLKFLAFEGFEVTKMINFHLLRILGCKNDQVS